MLSHLFSQIGPAIRALGWSAGFYCSHALLPLLATLPALLRSYQLYSRSFAPALEVVVALARVAVFLAIVAVGRGISLGSTVSRATWEGIVEEVAASSQGRWGVIAAQVATVLTLVLLFNRVTEQAVSAPAVAALLEERGLDPAGAPRARDAALFAVKNILVIPLWVICLLRILRVVGGTGK